jgi:hypothetical protein
MTRTDGEVVDRELKRAARLAERETWAKTVHDRLHLTRQSLRHNSKRAMTYGGIALVLGAVGPALIVNRVLIGPDADVQVAPRTFAIFCLVTAAAIAVAWGANRGLLRFHRELAATHSLFFANVLASSIRHDEERSQTLGRLALAIAERTLEPLRTADKKPDEPKP